MAIDGMPKFRSLAVKELAAEFKGGNVILTAKAAFVDTSTGATHGWTRGEGSIWSRETLEKLIELGFLMEQDLARLHFSDHTSSGTRASAQREPGGIAEHLSDDAEQA